MSKRSFLSFAVTIWVLGLPILMVTLASSPVFAAKPVIGVVCKGGFFVASPDRNIFWIDGDRKGKTSVYTNKKRLWAMAECGSGVVSVFRSDSQQTKTEYEAFYSPDCMNIGAEKGATKRLYQGTEPVIRITPVEKGVELRLANKKIIKNQSCSANSGG